jgi:ketopantoate reductase
MAVELSLAGCEVCEIARGAHLQAIRERGLMLLIDEQEKVARVAASGFRPARLCDLRLEGYVYRKPYPGLSNDRIG